MSVRTLRYNTIEQHFTKGVTASTDRDALAFLEAAQIYNTNQQRAIVNLVRSLKRVGLWSKMKAIYPFVGGTATSHKWNLKDPRDVNAAYRLSFTGGFTHNSEGIIGNGTNAVADSFINLSSITSGYSCNISVYMRTAGAGPSHGCANALATLVVFYPIRSGKANSALFKYSPFMIPDVNTTGKGLFAQNREDGTTEMIYYNGSLLKSQALAATGKPTFTMRVMGFAGQAPFTPEYNAATMSSMTVGDGLTSTEQQTLYNIIDLYQKRLGRAV
jgi:hypothetical protein